MNVLHENLISNIKDLLGKLGQQTLTMSDINTKIPETLANVLAVLGDPDFSVSNDIIAQKQYLVIENGEKHYCTEAQVAEFRKKNANILLDIPDSILKVCVEDNNQEFDFEKLPISLQYILESGMSQPGELLNKNGSKSRETLKRYIYETRRLLGDNKQINLIKTSRQKSLPNGNYSFNKRFSYIVIKNQKSTFNPPSINQRNL